MKYQHISLDQPVWWSYSVPAVHTHLYNNWELP